MGKLTRAGISLIILVITIIVIIILAGSILVSLSSNNPISEASKAVYLSDLKNFQTELSLYQATEFSNKLGEYDPKLLAADDASLTYDGTLVAGKTMFDLIPSIDKSGKYEGQFQIVDGALVYGGLDSAKQDWSTEIGVEVVIIGEPKITILPPMQTLAERGTDVVYTVKFSSNLPLTTINLESNIEVLDDSGVPVLPNPVISFGTISGTSADATRQVDITIQTDTLLNGEYKLNLKPGVVTNSNNISNTIDIASLIGFSIVDNIPPENPVMSANPTELTNGNVSVTINYSEDSLIKEFSTDFTNWSNYSVPVVVTENNTTVYARGKDIAGNESGVSTLNVTNIDKISPTEPIMSSTPINGTTAQNQNVVFGESTNQSQSQIVTIPNLSSVTNSSVNTGSVNTSVSGDNVTVNCLGGTSTRNVWDPNKYSSYVSNYLTGSTSSFAAANSYGPDGGGYSGSLGKNGTSYVISGSYTASDSFTASSSQSNTTNVFPTTVAYNSGGYSGTLTKNGSSTSNTVQTGGSYTPSDSKTVTAYRNFSCNAYYIYDGVTDTNTRQTYNPVGWLDYYYNVGGYVGTIHISDLGTWTQTYSGSWTALNQEYLKLTLSYTGTNYVGLVTKPAVDTRTYSTTYTQAYSGTVTKPAVDTRTWRQDYIGWAYKGGYTYYYEYTAILNYLVESTTTASITILYPDDATNKQYSIDGSTWNTYTISITVNLNTTVYSRCYDEAGNISTTASKVAN